MQYGEIAVEKVLGLEMEDDEFARFWTRFDTTGDGRVDYAEFNNRLGSLIHPPAGQLLMNRPETPRIKDWQKKRLSSAIKAKMQNLEKAFKEIDTDGSGAISHPEFIQALRKLGLTKIGNEESYQMMRKHKSKDDESEDMTWEQFKKTMQDYLRLPDLPTDETDPSTGAPSMKMSDAEKILAEKLYGKFTHVQRAFRMFDEDKSGSLDHEEFRMALRAMGVTLSERDFQTLVMQYDKSGDGSISYDEFNARVGPLIHPEAVNRNTLFNAMEAHAGAQSGLHYDPSAKLGLNARDADGNPLSQSARARLIAPRLGITEGEAVIARELNGRFSEVQKAFRTFDADKSGALSPAEFSRALESMGVRLSHHALMTMLEKYDTSGDGVISYDEFNMHVGPLLAKSAANDELLGFTEERADEAAASASASASASARVSSRRPESGRLSARPISAAGKGIVAPASGAEAKPVVPSLTLRSAEPPSPMRVSARGDVSVARSRPSSAMSSGRRSMPGKGGAVYNRKSGFVPTVKHVPSSLGGLRAPEVLASARTGETASLTSIDIGATEDKMRRILGRSWDKVYGEIRAQQKREAGNVISTHRFRDAMAERGVPLTSKEVRALAKRYSTPSSTNSIGSARELDYEALMRSAFGDREASAPE
jgi:Ca2+-binding EF-hand superfamily protein